MGQLALGLRSLAIRLAIFVVMAALLAWALGGTLLPRAQSAEYDAVDAAGRSWYWRLDVGGHRIPELDPLGVRWTLMVRAPDGPAHAALTDGWVDVTGPVALDERIWFAGRADSNPATEWRLHEVVPAAMGSLEHELRDLAPLSGRLEAELQLARLGAGRPAMGPNEVRELLRVVTGATPAPPAAPASAPASTPTGGPDAALGGG